MPGPTSPRNTSNISRGSSSWPIFTILLLVLIPVLAAMVVYQLESFEPASLPLHELTQPPLKATMKNGHMLQGSEFVGVGQLQGPEDIAYDSKSGLIYTSCEDGWIKRIKVNESVADMVVENWVNTGGRPLGVALGRDNDVIVADSYKGLLKISSDGAVEVLTNEAEGLKFKLTDAVDIADDGMIYFTDASYKYSFHEFMWDIIEGKPHGRLVSFDPVTKTTQVLVRDLYFANGVAISPYQDYVLVCETPLRRCRKYYIQGKKKGSIENFIHLPGPPDNIHYDGNGHYLIAIATEMTTAWDLTLRYPFIRKVLAIILRYTGPMHMEKNSGVFVVDLEGKPTAHYHDPGLKLLSSGIKIGTHLYCGSIGYPYLIRLNLDKHPAHANT